MVAFCQEIRNRYLRTNVHGHTFLDVSTGPDPVPKKLMRIAAQLAYRENGRVSGPAGPDRIDVLEGLEYLTVLLNGHRNLGSEISGLRQRLAINRAARGEDTPFSADDLLLLTELLSDKAKSLVLLSPLQKIGTAIERLAGGNDS